MTPIWMHGDHALQLIYLGRLFVLFVPIGAFALVVAGSAAIRRLAALRFGRSAPRLARAGISGR